MDLRQLRPSREHDAPIYLQLYRRFREAIAAGKLRPGDRVPSVRSLASELNLARGTVELAYQLLASEGYFLARGPAGTVVSPQLASLEPARAPAAPPAGAAQRPAGTARHPWPFQLGLPALDVFPRKTWARLAAQAARDMSVAALNYPDPDGHEALRRAIAAYLGISRGIACGHEQVFVTQGYRGALELACQAVLRRGDLGWHEDPGYRFARAYLERAGMRLAAVPVDEQGLSVAQGRRIAEAARFAVVTPTHQSPLGVALSLPRRLALLEWAGERQAWIIEDDYDSEFRYHGRPLPALKSLDRDGRVLYTGTFSKVLFPGLRLAYLVVPLAEVERFRAAALHLPGPALAPQEATTRFMEQGHFARHLRRMRALYATRRAYLAQALEQSLGRHLEVQNQAGGIHILARLKPAGLADAALAARAQARGLAVQPLSQWYMGPPTASGLLLGFTNIASPDMAAGLSAQLARALGLRS
ncbi:PLP-dependent aminotransferase family protein [Bordetella pseudohinzii]|uniref:DNA-binding protein n=1 Tax=Bordetella pseudohinzii TaxID=1331258 RepID=A0A0J6C0D8_9BORD|nr:PLP-dependent aminotransferase family protein [Bordetella pseudohinzii]ANY16084.1 DNA-binding protein [Bordetella pseudohinzii]KMM24518.1 DNA-binding protein [Bordetella pseudohinzii]KXA78539.1 DNA-binding protein [Bordetella pseudohinzii]KXA78607.1 DNA-binding protein [Bordetella pseudohinzii]CUJ10930.1 HTH-type transcriptional regulatory protein gabR [Bordetella pseudohinzii]